eukprot:scaffold82304_cov36-Tisochrysis_lutea.AAC.1
MSAWHDVLQEKEEKNHVGSESTPHQLRKRRHSGSKSCEPPSPEGKREASVGVMDFWQHATPRHRNFND